MSDGSGSAYGPWRIQKSTMVYQDPWLAVRCDDVTRPDGRPGTHSVVTIKPGICVLAVDQEMVYLTEEFHYAVGRTTLEAVSGGRDDDESPLQCAQRELAEELGITATEWHELGVIDPFTSSVISPTVLFVASGLTFQSASPDGTELIRPVQLSFADTLLAVQQGRITHAPSCIAILRYALEMPGQSMISRNLQNENFRDRTRPL